MCERNTVEGARSSVVVMGHFGGSGLVICCERVVRDVYFRETYYLVIHLPAESQLQLINTPFRSD